MAGGLTLMLALASSWRDRQELQKVTAANDFLRKSLGEMSIAITAKEKEIDRLEQAGCAPAAADGSGKGARAR
jgi:hypothetical protein